MAVNRDVSEKDKPKCRKCKITLTPINTYRNRKTICKDCDKESAIEWYHSNTEQAKKTRRDNNRKARLELIELLGGRCSNPACTVPGGERDWRALQIDHVNGGGCKEFRESKGNYYSRMLQSISETPERYQLLCSNCNWKKKYEKDEVYKGDLNEQKYGYK